MRMEKHIPSSGPKKLACISILISVKIDFANKLIKGYREGYHIIIKGKIHQGNFAIPNIYITNKRPSNFFKRTLQLPSHFDPHTMMVGDFNTPTL